MIAFPSKGAVAMVDRKTPGVYIVETNAFPNSAVKVETAIPAFIGCTEKAERGGQSLIGIPTKISSLSDYHTLFGEAPDPVETVFYTPAVSPAPFATVSLDPVKRSFFYSSIRLFFNNGGGTCYIFPVKTMADTIAAGGINSIALDDLCKDALTKLEIALDVTMVVVPDAVGAGIDVWANICSYTLQHCIKLQNRIGIFDVVNGDQPRDLSDANDVISGTNGFRARINADGDGLNYGVAYYPWLNTSLLEAADVDFTWITTDKIGQLVADLLAEADADPKLAGTPQTLTKLKGVINAICGLKPGPDARTAHQILLTNSVRYRQLMVDMLAIANVVPPSGAMAGVYTRVDSNLGVFCAPANVGITCAVSPTVPISDEEQENLNMPMDGKAVNAIRVIPQRGLMVWGARTLLGNSQDWRYINVRRTVIMLEQSIKLAMEGFVFHPNTSVTWMSVTSMIVNFLTARWQEGALAGAKAEDAFSVAVGLGSTMTATDILDGYMNVTVLVAVTHPAEFIELTFKQQLQKS